ncbi:MAG: ABC transporter permease subunit [Hyphomicrobiales bacterium]|nr:ABC transporter permease subunit [Hyphomicrobiales bacterium]
MASRRSTRTVVDHLVLIAGSLLMLLPVAAIFLTSTHQNSVISQQGLQMSWGPEFSQVYGQVLTANAGFSQTITAGGMALNSTILALGFALGKCLLSILSAYALVYFRLRFASFLFWVIFASLLLPIETRILPSFMVVHTLGLLNSYTGLIVPLLAAAIGTFFFRQFFKSVPNELHEAARIDGAGPTRFLIDILLPVSWPMVLALFAVTFVQGWNQYLWPLMITTTGEGNFTLVRGIERFGTATNYGMALAILAMLPPVMVVLILQKWLIKGLVGEQN